MDPAGPMYSLPADAAQALAQLLSASWPYVVGLAVVVWAILVAVRWLGRAG